VTDQTPSPAPSQPPTRDTTVKFLLGVIALLLVVIAGGIVYLIVSGDGDDDGPPPAAEDDDEPSPSPAPTPAASPSPSPAASPGATPTPEEIAAPLAPEVRTDRPRFGLQIESISLSENGAIMAFAVVHHGNSCDRFFFNQKQLARSFLVHEATGKRFGVVKGPGGEPQVSPAQGRILCNPNDNMRFTIEFRAPPPGSTVDVIVPFAEPITDLTLS
jgi:hypothetical protein